MKAEVTLLTSLQDKYSPSPLCATHLQADDGSLKTIKILNTQVSELAAQKGNLLARVADMQQDQALLEKRLEHALNEAAEQRRQRVEMLTHRVRAER